MSEGSKSAIWPIIPLLVSLVLTILSMIWAVLQPSSGAYALIACLPLVGLSWWFALATNDGDDQRSDDTDK